jgi:hypothetical protein
LQYVRQWTSTVSIFFVFKTPFFYIHLFDGGKHLPVEKQKRTSCQGHPKICASKFLMMSVLIFVMLFASASNVHFKGAEPKAVSGWIKLLGVFLITQMVVILDWIPGIDPNWRVYGMGLLMLLSTILMFTEGLLRYWVSLVIHGLMVILCISEISLPIWVDCLLGTLGLLGLFFLSRRQTSISDQWQIWFKNTLACFILCEGWIFGLFSIENADADYLSLWIIPMQIASWIICSLYTRRIRANETHAPHEVASLTDTAFSI